MRNHNHHIGRRSVLKGAGIGLAGLAGLASPAAAKGGRVSLLDGPAEFQLFWSGADGDPTDADDLADFGYPAFPGDPDSTPFLATEDPNDMPPGDQGGFFDGSDIEKTPNGRTLHHTLQFFQGFLIEKDRGKPYVLVNQGQEFPGFFRFESRGQHVNFEARSAAELGSLVGSVGGLADPTPIFTLAGGTWRGVGAETVYVLADGDEPGRAAPYSATRVDFYDRSGGTPEYAFSLLYIIYPNLDDDGNPTPATPGDPDIKPIPAVPWNEGAQLIQGGVRNLGGR